MLKYYYMQMAHNGIYYSTLIIIMYISICKYFSTLIIIMYISICKYLSTLYYNNYIYIYCINIYMSKILQNLKIYDKLSTFDSVAFNNRKFIFVNDIGDLPTAISNVILLEENTTYFISDLTLTNISLAFPSGYCKIVGGIINWSHTSDEPFFKQSNYPSSTNSWISTIHINNNSGVDRNMFDISSASISNQNLRFKDFTCFNFSGGSISNLLVVSFIGNIFGNADTGLIFTDIVFIIFQTAGFIASVNNIATDFLRFSGSNFISPTITINSYTSNPYSNQYGIRIDDNLTPNFNIHNSFFDSSNNGSCYNPLGLNQSSIYVNSKDVRYGVPDSISLFEQIGSNIDTTTILAQYQNKICNLTNLIDIYKEEFTTISTNRITFIGLQPTNFKLNGNISIEPLSGVNKNITIQYVCLHSSITDITFDNTTNIVIKTNHGFVDTDIISFYNTSGTVPSELDDKTIYYIINSTTNNFQLSYTIAGSIITFIDDGTPSNQLYLCDLLGISSLSRIDANSPISMHINARGYLSANMILLLVCSNQSDDTDIKTTRIIYISTYFKTKKNNKYKRVNGIINVCITLSFFINFLTFFLY